MERLLEALAVRLTRPLRSKVLSELKPGGVTIEAAEVVLLGIARTLLDLQLRLAQDPSASLRVENIPVKERWQWHKLAEDASFLGQRKTVDLPPLSHETAERAEDGSATLVFGATTIERLTEAAKEHRKKKAPKPKKGRGGRARAGSRSSAGRAKSDGG